jgi:ATP-dependent DNA helicase RecG
MKLTTSPSILAGLNDLGIFTFEDVLKYPPRTYEDLTPTEDVLLIDKQRVVFLATITSSPRFTKFGKLSMVSFHVILQTGIQTKVVAFNRPYLVRSLKVQEVYTIVGQYDERRQSINLSTIISGSTEGTNPLKPIYRLPQSIENYQFVRLVKKAFLEVSPTFFEQGLPEEVIKKHQLISYKKALLTLHFPKNIDEAYEASRYVKYKEAYDFMQHIQRIKLENTSLIRPRTKSVPRPHVDRFIDTLPYRLTSDQYQVLEDILNDFERPQLMYRLLQGDVGSGKTVVATTALFANALRGFQGALLAPTDALAKQHFLTIQSLLKHTDLKVALLVGHLDTHSKTIIKDGLKKGTIDIVIGTHALFSEDVGYQHLGCVVIDEQHRFGTNQRDALLSKGREADLLMMSATPIPRSLALTVYADMDVSTLTQFPFKERKIRTKVIEEDDGLITYAIQEALMQQKRVYIIAPSILEKEEGPRDVQTLYEMFHKQYPGFVVMMHGQLLQEEKEAALESFSTGKTPIIIATTVIEVGIDVKPATVMIIYDADRFGLASLHQLRGRIGRDGSEGLCLLVVQNQDVEGRQRLEVLESSNDGFYISEQDLLLRGPGELTGNRQSGLPLFQYLNIIKDHKIIKEMKQFVSSLEER